jgi:hypothetical protein
VTFKINDLMVDVLSTEMHGKEKDCGPCTKCTKCTEKTGPMTNCTDTQLQDCCGTKAEWFDATDIEALRAQLRATLDAKAA